MLPKILIIGACLLSSAAMAQDFTLEVNANEINMIGEGLGFLPYNKVAPLIQSLQIQVNKQNQPKPEEKKIEAPKIEAPKVEEKKE